MKLPILWMPSSIEPSVTPVAANATSPDATIVMRSRTRTVRWIKARHVIKWH
jgi:hypothetical protein